MSKSIRLLFALLLTLSCLSFVAVCNANANAIDELDECYVDGIMANMEAEGNDNYSIYQVKMLDTEGGFGWLPEYLYVIAWGENHSKVFIYRVEHLNVIKIWESIEIPGWAFEAASVDLNDDWVCEHLLFTKMQDEHDTRWYQIWVFSWEGINSRLIYPKEMEDNKLTSLNDFTRMNLDYDKDWTYEFIVQEKEDEEHRYYKYYTFNKENLDELVIEKEEIEVIKLPQPQSQQKELTVEEKYPKIVKFMQDKHSDIQIYGIYSIPDTFRYMVLSNIGKVVVDQRMAGVTEVCVLGSNFDEYVFIPHMAMALDIDNDSMPEIPLYSFDDVENRKLYFYFVSVQPGKCKMLSPLDDNGQSKIWTMDEPVHYTRADDDNLVIVGYKYTKDGHFVDSYWKWNPKAQQLIEVLDF